MVDVQPECLDLLLAGFNIQPDAYIRMPTATVLIEATRIHPGSFRTGMRVVLSVFIDHRH